MFAVGVTELRVKRNLVITAITAITSLLFIIERKKKEKKKINQRLMNLSQILF